MRRMLLPSWSLMFAVLFGAMVQARSLKLGRDVHTQAIGVERGQFIYLVQGEGVPAKWVCDVGARPDAQVIYASYALELNSICEGIARAMYLPGSTWTTGRNALYEESLKLQLSQKALAEYIIFMDGDAKMYATSHFHWNPYDLFHASLSNVQPAVASVQGNWPSRNACGPVAPCAPDMDAIVTAFHATAAPMLLPYSTAFDNESWWDSQGVLIELMLATMPEYVVQFNNLQVINSGHSNYPKSADALTKPEDGFSRVATYLRERVTDCVRERIGAFQVGGSAQCHPCLIGSQCEDSPECLPLGGIPPQRVDYKDLVECKPFL